MPVYATDVGGMLNADTTWEFANSPFNLISDIQVNDGVTLTIEPGVEVNGNYYKIINAGNVLAIGIKNSIIIFNSIAFQNASDREYALLSFDYCYMNTGTYFHGWFSDGSLVVKNSILEGPKSLTIFLLGTAFGSNEKVDLIGNELIDIGKLELSFSDPGGVNILNNLFTGNSYISSSGGYADIRNNSFMNKEISIITIEPSVGNNLTAIDNFWNTTDSNVIESMIFDGNDDLNITGYVSYDPWLMAPHPDTPGIDTDGDGISDHADGCPYDSNKTVPGFCGCGSPDTDADQDKMMDCWEELYGLNVFIDDSEDDLDKDGYTNIQEYQEDTIPNDPESHPSKANLLPVLFLLLDDTSYDPNAPRSIIIDTSLDVILNDGIDETTITVDVMPYDQANGIIDDGTIINFNVISGSATLSNSSVATINGQAKVTLTSLSEGNVTVSVKVKDTYVSSFVDIGVVSDFSFLFSKSFGSSLVIINGYFQPGSQFSLTIINNSTRTFDLTRAELRNGRSIVSYTTDISLLSNGQLTQESQFLYK
jgi:hypothetical protein